METISYLYGYFYSSNTYNMTFNEFSTYIKGSIDNLLNEEDIYILYNCLLSNHYLDLDKISILRGYFDRYCHVMENTCIINTCTHINIIIMSQFPSILFTTNIDVTTFVENDALEILSKLYDNIDIRCRVKTEYQRYFKVTNTEFRRVNEMAITPKKSRASDSGYDMYLINELKRDGETIFFDTGIQISAPFSYYYQLVARSSLSKTGYILANSVGIIDNSYTGNIIAALIKIDKSKPDLKLPFKGVQLVLCKHYHSIMTEVVLLNETDRGDGGFGSTD